MRRISGIAVWVAMCLACGGMPNMEPLPPGPPPTLLAPASAEDLAPLLEPVLAEHGVPALAGAVVHHGEVVGIGAVGLDRTDQDGLASIDDRWHVGSNGKAMTATLIARLVERGTLSWDTTIGDTLSDLEPHPDLAPVTLEQLLTHRSGILANPGKPWMIRLVASSAPPREARRTVLKAMLAKPPLFEPGTEMLYSNTGYVTAGAIAEAVTDTPWEQLMEDEVFRPLGVEDFGFGPPPPPSPAGHVGETHTPVEPVPIADNPRALGPAGTMHFTFTSWARFVAAHVAGDRGEHSGYLSDETWAKLHEPQLNEYAMGWGVRTPDKVGARVLAHSGSNTMWYAQVMAVPEWDAAILVATNCGTDICREATPDASQAMLDAWRGRLQPDPEAAEGEPAAEGTQP